MNLRFYRRSVAAKMADVRLLLEGFDPARTLSDFVALQHVAGGIASFLGQVRGGDDTEILELQHFAPLTLPAMEALADEAKLRWSLENVLIHHRSGPMAPGDPIVLVAAAARHRRDALNAVDFIMDHLKSRSWFWKRERRGGEWHWIEPREQDFGDAARWGDPA